jgi:glutamate carboxypeptidase
LVFEGGRAHDQVITCRKGGATFTLKVAGRAAHAGNDHASGVNAIHVLSLLVPRIEALTDYDRGVTVNVGLIEGGTAKNTVPDAAHCVIDARFERAADADAVVAALQGLAADPPLEGAPDRLRQAEVTLSGGVTRPPMEATEASQQLRARYERWAALAGLGGGEAPRQGGGSDANLLAAHGVPTIDGLGPYGMYFHKPQEWSSLLSLRRRTRALAAFLAAAQGDSSPGS